MKQTDLNDGKDLLLFALQETGPVDQTQLLILFDTRKEFESVKAQLLSEKFIAPYTSFPYILSLTSEGKAFLRSGGFRVQKWRKDRKKLSLWFVLTIVFIFSVVTYIDFTPVQKRSHFFPGFTKTPARHTADTVKVDSIIIGNTRLELP